MSLKRVGTSPEGVFPSRNANVMNRDKRRVADWLRPDSETDWLIWVFIPVALAAGFLLGLFSSFTLAALAVAGLVLAYLVALDQRALVAVILVAIGVLIDFCQVLPLPFYFPALAIVLALLFLAAVFLAQSSERPWMRVPHLGWWVCLLIIALVPALRGGLAEGGRYYVTVLLNALLFYVIGIQIVRDMARLRQLFGLLSGFATLIAIHSFLQARTGNVLLPTHYWDSYLASVNYFTLAGSHAIRAGSFFINPDSDGAFLALMFFIPVGLLLETSSRLLKGLYLVEAALILLGLFFTYSLASIISVCAGGILFILLVVRGRSRYYACGLIGLLLLAVLVAFPSLLRLLYTHASNASELTLRVGAWETGIRVILAHPLTGLGLSFYTYLSGAEPYRVPLQYRPLYHPHNSFLELGALGGLPVLMVFLILFVRSFWLALRNLRGGEKAQRALLGGGITALTVITMNSFADNAWTLPPLILVGWLIFGAVSSPALFQCVRSPFRLEKGLHGSDREASENPLIPGGVQA